MLNSENENKTLIEETYSDKSIKLLTISVVFLVIDIVIYIFFLYIVYSDFGVFFETISLILSIISINLIRHKKFDFAKKTIIGAAFPMCWLLVYDLIDLVINYSDILIDVSEYYLSGLSYYYYLSPFLFDMVSIALIIIFYLSHSSLCIADGTKKKTSFVDSFYDEK